MAGLSRRIVCGSCGKEGVVQAYDTVATPPEDLFVRLPKDAQGYSHFRCPNCGDDLTVDPVDLAQHPEHPMLGRSSFAGGELRPATRRKEDRAGSRLLAYGALVGLVLLVLCLACR